MYLSYLNFIHRFILIIITKIHENNTDLIKFIKIDYFKKVRIIYNVSIRK